MIDLMIEMTEAEWQTIAAFMHQGLTTENEYGHSVASSKSSDDRATVNVVKTLQDRIYDVVSTSKRERVKEIEIALDKAGVEALTAVEKDALSSVTNY